MMQFKKYNKYFFTFWKDNLLKVIIYIVLVPCITFICLYTNTLVYIRKELHISLADFLITTGNSILFYINLMFIPCILLSLMIRQNFSLNNIIRHKSKRILFCSYVYYGFLLSLFTSLYQFISSSIIGYTLSDSLINFDQSHSIFWFVNQGICSSVTFIEVLCYTFIFCFLYSCLLILIYLILKWFLFYDLIGILFLIILGLCDIYGGIGLCRLIGTSYVNLITYHPIYLLILCVGILICGCISIIFSRKREFLHES